MKIEKIKIKNFKSFGDFEIGQFTGKNLIYGPNNSGKSNFLKFLSLVFGKKSSATPYDESGNFWDGIISKNPYLFRNNNNQDPIEFEILVRFKEAELEAVFEPDDFSNLKQIYFRDHDPILFIQGAIQYLNFYDSEIRLTYSTLNNIEIFLNKEYFSSSPGVFGEPLKLFEDLVGLLNQKVALLQSTRYFEHEDLDPNARHLDSRHFANWLFNLSLDPESQRMHSDLFDKLTEYSESFFSSDFFSLSSFGFSRSDEKIEILLNAGRGHKFPVRDFGTGIQQILFILVFIITNQSKILLIEEMELNLSPTFQIQLLKCINELIARNLIPQVFFTSHSDYFNFRTDFSIYESKFENDETRFFKTNKKTTTKKNSI